jgi:hypothetical protein
VCNLNLLAAESNQSSYSEGSSQGSCYQGEELNGRRHGQGRHRFADGRVYEGEWFEDEMEGEGKLISSRRRLVYEGGWLNSLYDKAGVEYNQTPCFLEGSFDPSDLREVHDYWSNYEGEFLQGQRHGQGCLNLTNGEFFRGQFEAGQPHGPGEFFTSDGGKLTGEWREGQLVQ